MEDSLAVHVLDSIEELRDHIPHFALVERSVRQEIVEKSLLCEILLHDEPVVP